MKRLIKFFLFEVLYPGALLLGADRMLRKRGEYKRLIIMYHGVSASEQRTLNGRHLAVKQFERQLQYLRKNFDIVSLETICESKYQKRKFVRHTIALTFDDGFVNNITTALPLLEKYNIPATFFICSASLADNNYLHPSEWLDVIGLKHGSVSINSQTFVRTGYSLVHTETGQTAYHYLNSLSYQQWNNVLTELKKRYDLSTLTSNVNREVLAVATADDVRRLGTSPVAAIGSHSHFHVNLTQLTLREVEHELQRSKSLLEQCVTKPVPSVAFPYGLYNEDTIMASRNVGYKYLIAAGDVPEKFNNDVFPRTGVLGARNYARNIVSINHAFKRFGF